MRVELVGGPRCGEIVELRYMEPDAVPGYVRRDRPFTLSGENGGCYGKIGHRMYDYVKPEVSPS